MLQKFINRLIRRNHYWRDLNFDELSELYTSMMFRSLAMSLVGIFIPVYLYQLGYHISQIFFFYSLMFAIYTTLVYFIAHLIAKIGPKHTILISFVAQVISLLMLISQQEVRWPLILVAFFTAIANGMFFTSFHVNFSKVKHREHGGKEVGWMYSMEKIGGVLGPLIGGLVAVIFGAQYIFLAAIALLFVGLLPLFLTSEATAINQKLNFRGLKVSDIKRDLVSMTFLNIENVTCIIIWPLFMGVFVFADNPYIQLGSITSASVLLSLFMAREIGKIIDEKKGRSMLRIGATTNAVLHLFRPLTTGYFGALGINLMNEIVTPAYRMPVVKGFYDAADDLPGRRIVYIAGVEAATTFGRSVLFAFAGILAYATDGSKSIFFVLFAIGAIASLGIMLEKFKALEPANE